MLHLTPEGAVTATNVMRVPVDEAALQRRQMRFRDEARKDGGFSPSLISWGVYDLTLELMYSGHWDRALRYFDETWPDAMLAEKTDSLTDLLCMMRESRFWPDVAGMNRVSVKTMADRCSTDRRRDVTWAKEIAGFDIEIREVPGGDSRLEVSKADNLIVQLRGTHFTMVDPKPFARSNSGAPMIVARDQDDENHDKGNICFFTYYLIELSDSARVVATTRSPYYDPPATKEWSNPQCGGEVARP